jgi:hypothetical protein
MTFVIVIQKPQYSWWSPRHRDHILSSIIDHDNFLRAAVRRRAAQLVPELWTEKPLDLRASLVLDPTFVFAPCVPNHGELSRPVAVSLRQDILYFFRSFMATLRQCVVAHRNSRIVRYGSSELVIAARPTGSTSRVNHATIQCGGRADSKKGFGRGFAQWWIFQRGDSRGYCGSRTTRQFVGSVASKTNGCYARRTSRRSFGERWQGGSTLPACQASQSGVRTTGGVQCKPWHRSIWVFRVRFGLFGVESGHVAGRMRKSVRGSARVDSRQMIILE